ncbi:AI-2E family transporter [Cupriavidus pampae]|uniref:Transport protein YdiK n=1 Tax=Cupriavidus pampae TaxID=659251 RepID=A0ABN7Z7D8_9BURK|nr:AI-2E family transporter [Cupriavidus pampae]CAG9180190.1 Putative transport protein YdiK [Cupriavidus pampae]
MLTTPTSGKALSRGMLDVLIRAGLIAALVYFCFRVFNPFLDLMIWSVILAISLYPLHVGLRNRMGGKDGRAATLMVIVALALIVVPTYLMGAAIIHSVEEAAAIVKGGQLHLPTPPEAVAGWPLIGKPLYDIWLQAATDITSLLQRFGPEIKSTGLTLLAAAAMVTKGLLMFLFALIIAGIVMAYGELGHRSAIDILSRIAGPEKGPRITALCTSTVRAVAIGVVGIAFIQMLLVGIGFVIKGVPAGGILALIVLLLGIMQLPATIITVPVIIYVFATEGAGTATVIFAIYTFIAGLADNVLKPIMLGRGVEVPMPVILIGALGGMVSGGIIGLFIGPVMLAVGYQLFWAWVRDPPPLTDSQSLQP